MACGRHRVDCPRQPALVVVSNAHRYSLALDGRLAWSTDHEDVWSAGLARTIERLSHAAAAVVVIGDTPRMSDDPPVCLSETTGRRLGVRNSVVTCVSSGPA